VRRTILRPAQCCDEYGMATAELAVALPLLTLMVLFGVGLVDAVRDDLRCHNAVRLAARAAARGESDDVVQSTAEAAAPAGARIIVARNGAVASVSISMRVGIPGPWSAHGPQLAVGAHAAAAVEPVTS
jgi:Flp pilus assembly protein TadG